MLARRIILDTERGYIEMEGRSLSRDQENIKGFIANPVGISQLVIYVGALMGEVTNYEFGAFDRVRDFSNNKSRSRVLVYARTS